MYVFTFGADRRDPRELQILGLRRALDVEAGLVRRVVSPVERDDAARADRRAQIRGRGRERRTGG